MNRSTRFSFILIFVTLLLTACSRGSNGPDLSNFFAPADLAPARVTEITTENIGGLLIPDGPDALGGIGDFLISNSQVQFIVDGGIFGTRGQHHLAATGGTLIDATFGGQARDQLNQILLFGNLDFGLPFVALDFQDVSPNSNEAALQVTGGYLDQGGLLGGGVTRDPSTGLVIGLEVVITYRLGLTDNFLTVESVVNNLTGVTVPLFANGFVNFAGNRSTKTFFPFPTRGLFHPTIAIPPAPTDFSFVPAIGIVGSQEREADINYAICSAQTGVMLAVASGSEPSGSVFHAFSNPGSPASTLGPTQSLNFTWQFFVGTPNVGSGFTNGCAPALGQAYRYLAENSTTPANIISNLGTVQGVIDPALKGTEVTFVQTSPALFTTDGGLTLTDFNTLAPGVGIPYSYAITQDNGFFSAVLPEGTYSVFIDTPQRPQSLVADVAVISNRVISIGLIDLLGEDPVPVNYAIRNFANSGLIPGKLTFKGVGATLDPDFGTRNLASGQRNIVYSRVGSGTVYLAPGTYDVYASRGPEWDVVISTITVPGTPFFEAFLSREVSTEGYISADFHVHAGHSFDSSLPIVDRLDSALGEGLDVVIASEHDNIGNWENTAALFEYGSTLRVYNGLEATSNVATLPIGPFAPIPAGHWISFPQRVRPEAGGNGAVLDEFVPPSVFMDLMASNTEFIPNIFVDPVPGTTRGFASVPMMLAHPRAGLEAGLIPIGFHNATGYDPSQPLLTPTNGFYIASPTFASDGVTPITSTRMLDYNMLEVLNGVDLIQYGACRTDWFSFLNQGEFKTAVGNSDSHNLEVPVGTPRNYFRVLDDDPLTLDDADFIASVLDGNGFLTNGPVVEVSINGAGPGQLVSTGSAISTVTLDITVQAASWVNTTALNIYRNGVLITSTPLTTSGIIRFSAPITESVDPGAGDSYYVVEVEGDVSTTYSLVNPDHTPRALTNPIFVDEDGNGSWQAPGL